ncbi:monomeric sarcosine oxidase-like [Glandiceps talaboti]
MAGSGAQYYEYIVVGCGGIGSATVYWLSKRVGKDVLGLEQFRLGHEHGGSQDHSRTMRVSYYGDERFTTLCRDSYTAFEEVEEESGIQLLYKCGGLQLSTPDSASRLFIEKNTNDLKRLNIPHARMEGVQIHERFHQFQTRPGMAGLYVKDMGFVDAAMANGVQRQLARKHGATILENCPVLKLEKDEDNVHVLVHTSQGLFRCRRLIISAGAWTNTVIKSLGFQLPLSVSQEQVTYVATPHLKDFTKTNFPVWDLFSGDHLFYGHPIHGNTGVKVAIHDCTRIVSTDTRTYQPDPVKEKICLDFLKKFIPQAVGPILYTKTCLYTNTPDFGFIADSLEKKGYPQIMLFVGAGHAYKFSCLFGKILTEMAITGKIEYAVMNDFKVDRADLRDQTDKDHHFPLKSKI